MQHICTVVIYVCTSIEEVGESPVVVTGLRFKCGVIFYLSIGLPVFIVFTVL